MRVCRLIILFLAVPRDYLVGAVVVEVDHLVNLLAQGPESCVRPRLHSVAGEDAVQEPE